MEVFIKNNGKTYRLNMFRGCGNRCAFRAAYLKDDESCIACKIPQWFRDWLHDIRSPSRWPTLEEVKE